MLSLVLATIITLISTFMYLPQTLRTVRGKNIQGVSFAGLANSTLSTTAWLVYLAQIQDWMIFVATLIPGILISVTLLSGLRQGGRIQNPQGTILWGVVLGGSFLVGSPYFGLVLSLSILLFYTPAAWHAWRAKSTRGVSLVSWSIAALEGILSAGYGFLEGNTAIMTYGTLAFIGASLVALAVHRDRRREQKTPNSIPQEDPVSPDLGGQAILNGAKA